jgi:membrane-bound metal-dependent hydrolase YbcI (DUF457 family)
MDRLSICTTLYFGSTKVRKYFRTLYESTRSCTSTSGSTSEVPVLYTYVYTYTYTYTCTHVIIFTFVALFISGGYKYLISYSTRTVQYYLRSYRKYLATYCTYLLSLYILHSLSYDFLSHTVRVQYVYCRATQNDTSL